MGIYPKFKIIETKLNFHILLTFGRQLILELLFGVVLEIYFTTHVV